MAVFGKETHALAKRLWEKELQCDLEAWIKTAGFAYENALAVADLDYRAWPSPFQAIRAELDAAEAKFRPFASAHEAYGVLMEEVRELEQHVFMNEKRRDVTEMRKEAVQVAAMAIRFIRDVCAAREPHANERFHVFFKPENAFWTGAAHSTDRAFALCFPWPHISFLSADSDYASYPVGSDTPYIPATSA